MHGGTGSAGSVTHKGRLTSVSSEICDILLDPSHGHRLVPEAEISGRIFSFQRQKSLKICQMK